MKFSEIKLPSNKKFGFFFSAVFLAIASYFSYIQSQMIASIMIVVSLFFFFVALFKTDLLMPLNILWMRFGLLIGMIINPIIMAIIFFMLITPYSIIMRVIGRDELCLKTISKSNWKSRTEKAPQTDFKKQF